MSETNSTADNSYAALFLDYINQSLAESLTTVRAVESRLPEEERVQACHILDFGLRSAESWASAKTLTIDLATYMERSGQWESWQQLLERAIAATQRLGDTDHEITLTALLARLYQRRGDAPAMVRAYRRVIRSARRHNNRFELARGCSNLGYHFIERGYLWRAELLSYYALAIFTELQSNHGRAHTHNHLGIVLTRQYEWAKAEEHLLAACTIWQKSQDQYGLMRGHGNLSFLYNETPNYGEAIAHATIALELAEASGEEPLIGNFASNLSFSYLKLGNIPKAKEFADLAERILKKYTDRSGLARLAHTKALFEIHENNYLQARTHIHDALNTLENYSLIQVKLTKLELEIRLQNYTVAKQELSELETWITKHLAGNAWQIYTDRLTKHRLYLERALPKSHAIERR
jgi:tetratricopeptide (TPR) repeat protein